MTVVENNNPRERYKNILISDNYMLAGKVNPNISLGKRFQTDEFGNGDKGFIRYIGSGVSAKQPKAVYVGVEFDDPTRGKHDGKLGDTTYFNCEFGKGAFLHPKRVIPGVNLGFAMKSRYADDETELSEFDILRTPSEKFSNVNTSSNTIDNSNITGSNETGSSEDLYITTQVGASTIQRPVEFAGKEQILDKLRQFHRLYHVTIVSSGVECVEGFDSYSGCRIIPSEQHSSPSLAQVFPSVRVLILDNNLLHSFSQLGAICKAFPHLSQLSLSFNALTSTSMTSPLLPEPSSSHSNQLSTDLHALDKIWAHTKFGGHFSDEFFYLPAFTHSPSELHTMLTDGNSDITQDIIDEYVTCLKKGHFTRLPSSVFVTKNLQVLVLNLTSELSWKFVLELAGIGGFPSLLELHLTHCYLSDLTPVCNKNNTIENPIITLDMFPKLKIANFSENNLTWNGVSCLHRLNIEKFYLQNNKIDSINHLPLNNDAVNLFPKLTTLSLADNNISDISLLAPLNDFKSLTDLRCQDNPVVKDAFLTQHQYDVRLLTVATLPKLESLNMSAIRDREHKDAEKMYLEWGWKLFKMNHKQAALDDIYAVREYLVEKDRAPDLIYPQLKIDSIFPRYSELCNTHVPPLVAAASKSSDFDALRDGEGSSLNDHTVLLNIAFSSSSSISQTESLSVRSVPSIRTRHGEPCILVSRGGCKSSHVNPQEKEIDNNNTENNITPKWVQKSVPLSMSVGDLHLYIKKTLSIPLSSSISLWYTIDSTHSQPNKTIVRQELSHNCENIGNSHSNASDNTVWGFVLDDMVKSLDYFNLEDRGFVTVTLKQ